MDNIEETIKAETQTLLRAAEKIAELNGTMAGTVASTKPEVLSALEDSSSIMSQVVRSLQDSKYMWR
jgi:hypothetical protein